VDFNKSNVLHGW